MQMLLQHSYMRSLARLQIQRPSIAYRMTRSLRCSSISLAPLKDPCAAASDLRNRGLSNSWLARDYCSVSSLVLVFAPLAAAYAWLCYGDETSRRMRL